MDREIPAEVQEALARGRVAYVRAEYADAAKADEEALDVAERLGCPEGIVRAARLLGVAEYRNGRAERSAELLEWARNLAKKIGWECEELLACNHLGGTLRKLGRLQEVHETLRGAIERANTREHLEVRARLMGSYGAFLDDLGEARTAAEHYARYEELLQLMDDPARLANARGLVSRAARLRGDLRMALSKAEDERRLGGEVGHPLREGRGWMHIAQAHAANGEMALAEAAFLEAAALLERDGGARTPVEIATARGQFYLKQGRLPAAYAQVELALRGLDELSEDEHAAKVRELAAEVAAAAGLHGEALWHLKKAMEHHLARFEPIADPRLKDMTRGRRRQLVELATRLSQEAGEVTREADERAEIKALLGRLDPDREAVLTDKRITLAKWRERVRERARSRWARLLTEQTLTALTPESQADLVLADVVYQGPVDDLGRSLLLIFASIERELRRVVGPELCPPDHPKTLAPLIMMLLGTDRPSRSGLDRQLRGSLLDAGHDLAALNIFDRGALRVDGEHTQKLTKIRNDIAHGNPLQLTRLDVDAIVRALTLGPTPVLPMLARLPGAATVGGA